MIQSADSSFKSYSLGRRHSESTSSRSVSPVPFATATKSGSLYFEKLAISGPQFRKPNLRKAGEESDSSLDKPGHHSRVARPKQISSSYPRTFQYGLALSDRFRHRPNAVNKTGKISSGPVLIARAPGQIITARGTVGAAPPITPIGERKQTAAVNTVTTKSSPSNGTKI